MLPRLAVDGADMGSDDELLGLLGQLNEAAASGAIQLLGDADQAGGTPVSGDPEVQAGQPGLVGPTAAELESIKELIQFDHEYLKPTMNVQNESTDTISNAKDSAQDASDATHMNLPMEVELDSGCIPHIRGIDSVQSFKTDDEDEMDLLLSMGTESAAFSNFSNSNVLTSDTSFTCDLKELMGLVGTKDCDVRSMSGKSDYGSGSDSGISDAPRSPFSDEGGLRSPGFGSPGLGDGLWEESFTDLFPSLDL